MEYNVHIKMYNMRYISKMESQVYMHKQIYTWFNPFALRSKDKRIMNKSYIKAKYMISKIQEIWEEVKSTTRVSKYGSHQIK